MNKILKPIAITWHVIRLIYYGIVKPNAKRCEMPECEYPAVNKEYGAHICKMHARRVVRLTEQYKRKKGI